jgi:hypothetical protein
METVKSRTEMKPTFRNEFIANKPGEHRHNLTDAESSRAVYPLVARRGN